MPPFDIQHIDHVVLRARQPERLVSFYTDVLGCTVERQLDIGLIQLRAGAALIDIVDAGSRLGVAGGEQPDPTRRNLDHFCLRVDPFEPKALRAYLAAAGVAAEAPVEVYGAEGFGLSVYCQDPEGNTVELKGPASRGPLTSVPPAGP